MDSTKDEFEKLAKDPNKLHEYLAKYIHEMFQTLNDDENFCNQDIDATADHVNKMKEKFISKFQEFQTKLDNIRQENQRISKENKDKFTEEMQGINELFEEKKYQDAWKKFKDYEKSFQQRPTTLDKIPRLSMNEADIERCFAPDHRPVTINPPPIAPAPTTDINDDQSDAIDATQSTFKEEQRRKKEVETVHISKDNEEISVDKHEQTIDSSQFGSRSKRVENPPAPTRKYCLSERLKPSPKKTMPSVNINFTLNPVSHYQHDRSKILLMACNYQYIVLFKSQRNRLDLWNLGAIERRTQAEYNLEWHGGLIISMGWKDRDSIYIFTEREFSVYSISQQRCIDSRILPRGNDDEWSSSSTEYQRGIGTIDDKHWYHIYSNRSAHWTLQTNSFKNNSANIDNKDLTHLFPDVARFIHFCVSEKVFHYLVQMNDLTYAVVTHDSKPVTLSGAQQPLTIYSSYNQKLKQYLCFINDPSIDVLHIVTKDQYLQSYPLTAYAICYHGGNNELMIVSNNLISSINLNQLNLVFS